MRRLLCLATALIAAQGALHTSATLPEDVKSGLFKGRSGDIVLKPNVHNAVSDRLAVFLDNAQGAFFTQNTEPVEATGVVNVAAGALGMTPLHPENGAPSVVAADFFTHAVANVLLAVESLGTETVSRHGLSKLADLRTRGAAHRLDFSSYPASSLALAASVATGQTPSQHGIVGRSWLSAGRTVQALSDDAPLQRANLADVLHQLYGGKPLTVSASADAQLARAFCSNPSLNAENDFCVTFDGKDFAAGAQHQVFSLRAEQIQRALRERTGIFGMLDGFTVSLAADGNTVSVQHATSNSRVEYDLRRAEDFALFAELAYAVALPGELSSPRWSSLVKDSTPDSYTLVFSALTGLVERYGRESQQFIMAARLIDAALPVVVNQFTGLYPARAAAEVLLLGSHDSAVDAQDKRQVREKLQALAPKAIVDAAFFPNIYTDLTASQRSQLCDVLTMEMGKLGYSTFCPANLATTPSSFISTSETSSVRVSTMALGADDKPTQAEIERYQVALWTAIGLAIVLFITIYSIAGMEIKKDSLLYGNSLSIKRS